MAFTYGDAPSSTRRDRFRLGIGDVEDWGKLSLTDNECDYILGLYSNDLAAWIAGCEMLAARCARYVDNTNIGISVSASQRFDMLTKMAQQYRDKRRSDSGFADLFRVPGASATVIDRIAADSDYPGNQFAIGMDDNPSEDDDGIEED